MASLNKRRPCARCGIVREAKEVRPLCRDCKSVLSEAEWLIWNDMEPDVELYHEKEVA